MKRTAKIAFPEIIFADAITYIVPKYYKYTSEKDAKWPSLQELKQTDLFKNIKGEN